MTWRTRRTWATGEPFPHTRSEIKKAGDRIRRTARAGEEPDDADLGLVDNFRRLHLLVVRLLQSELSGLFHAQAGIPEERLPITSRLKTSQAMIAKVCRSSTSLARMQDIAGARIVVPALAIQDPTLQAVTMLFGDSVTATKDQREEPDQYGYRAVHVIVRTDSELRGGVVGEIQIRTVWQDRWAQVVESLDATLSSDLKHGQGPAEWLEWLHALGDEFRKADLGQPYVMPPTPFDQEVEI